jgi:hypothetical protein
MRSRECILLAAFEMNLSTRNDSRQLLQALMLNLERLPVTDLIAFHSFIT